MELTRRGFFKATTIGSTIALGFDVGKAKAEMREFKISRTTETRSICPYCAVSCGVIIHTLGDKAKNVTPQVSIRRRSWTPSVASARLASTSRPPLTNGRNSSATDTSNESGVTANSVSALVKPGSRWMEASRFTTVRCSISTPLGRPVEPEV